MFYVKHKEKHIYETEKFITPNIKENNFKRNRKDNISLKLVVQSCGHTVKKPVIF